MGKVKLTKEKVEGLKIFCNSSKENCIIAFIEYNGSFKSNLAMNKVSLDELISYLYDNYEVEENPEEKILQAYLTYEDDFKRTRDTYFKAKQTGMVEVLLFLGIKIKGINEE